MEELKPQFQHFLKVFKNKWPYVDSNAASEPMAVDHWLALLLQGGNPFE